MTTVLTDKLKHWLKQKPETKSHFSPEEFLKSLNYIVGLDQLLDSLSAKLRENLNAQAVYIVLFEPITNRYVGKKAKGSDETLLAGFNFSHSDNLIRWLTVNRCQLDVPKQTEVVKFLSPFEQDLIRRTGVVLIVPLIVVNRLTGALFLTAKADGTSYESHEENVLSLLANHTALAIEHALMYQFQESRLKKMFHADQLATVGELAAGAAHEIRNPLTSIRSTVQYLKKDMPIERQPLVDGIIEEVDRIDEIIKGLLSLSKSSELQVSQIDVQEIIHQTLTLLDSELKRHNIALQQQIELDDTTITADPSQMKQLLLNVFMNSIQAMPNGGTITYSLSDNKQNRSKAGMDDSLRLSIGDTGVGIPASELQKVFDPFYTTKENGTGLGLSISYGIVSKHGGEIDIESSTAQPNNGTTVSIYLPRHLPHKLSRS